MSETTSHITRIEQDRTIASAAPPTPDRAAVREALVRVLENCPPHFVGRLGDHLATKRDWTCEAIADALLARVPAEKVTAERPYAWVMYATRYGKAYAVFSEVERDIAVKLGHHCDLALYARATPPAAETGREDFAFADGWDAAIQRAIDIGLIEKPLPNPVEPFCPPEIPQRFVLAGMTAADAYRKRAGTP